MTAPPQEFGTNKTPLASAVEEVKEKKTVKLKSLWVQTARRCNIDNVWLRVHAHLCALWSVCVCEVWPDTT